MWSWSRIARRLPGRTDNDIKNYWKTRMRMKAQERETSMSPSSLTTYTSCLLDSNSPVDVMSCGDTHNNFSSCIIGSALESTRTVDDGFVMDQIWREMETPLQAPALPQVIHQADEKTCSSIVPLCTPATTAAMWDDQCPEVFWNMDAEEIRMLAPQFDCAESWMNKSATLHTPGPSVIYWSSYIIAPCWFLEKKVYATTLCEKQCVWLSVCGI